MVSTAAGRATTTKSGWVEMGQGVSMLLLFEASKLLLLDICLFQYIFQILANLMVKLFLSSLYN